MFDCAVKRGDKPLGIVGPRRRARMRIDMAADPLDNPGKQEEIIMPTMSNLRRRKIQARQRKIENTAKREAKIAKKEHNAKTAG